MRDFCSFCLVGSCFGLKVRGLFFIFTGCRGRFFLAVSSVRCRRLE